MELRPTRLEDLPGLSALFEQRFGHGLTLEEWTWKYRQIPGESRSWVAVAPDGEILAHAGALALPARWSGGEAGIWQLVDFAGKTQRRGLRPAFVDLGQALLADIPRPKDAPFIFGFPSERHFRLGGRVFGYQPLTEVAIWKGELAGAIRSEGAESDQEEPLFESGGLAFEGVEAIWEACAVQGVRRSTGFLNWRYYARPQRYYRFYRLRAGNVAGLAVFAFVGEEARAAELWLPGGGDWLPSLRAVTKDLQGSGIRSWTFWSPVRPEWAGLLPDLGLVSAGETQFVGCRGGEGGLDPQVAAQGFTYSMGDFDLT
jgi:hypothetical protein